MVMCHTPIMSNENGIVSITNFRTVLLGFAFVKQDSNYPMIAIYPNHYPGSKLLANSPFQIGTINSILQHTEYAPPPQWLVPTEEVKLLAYRNEVYNSTYRSMNTDGTAISM